MNTHEFTLTLSGVAELTTEVEDGLFEAGCDDALLAVQSGRVTLDFARDGASLEDAVLSAVHDVRRAGVGADVVRVDGPDGAAVRAVNAALELARLRAADPGLVARVGTA